MHAALPSSLRVILTFRNRFLDTIKCEMDPYLRSLKCKNYILESRKCCCSINNSKDLSLRNIHFCLKALVLAFFGGLSKGINSSHTHTHTHTHKTKTVCEKKYPVSVVQLSLQKTSTAFILEWSPGCHLEAWVSGILWGL